MSDNRRLHDRELACFPAHVDREPESGNTSIALIRDISLTGAKLLTSQKLGDGDSIQVRLYLHDDLEKPRVVQAKVVRVEREEKGSFWTYRVGVTFDEPVNDCEPQIQALALRQKQVFKE